MAGHAVARRLVTSGRALTRTTEWAASRWGTAYFLPALFADRVTHLGGIDKRFFAEQLAQCRSFRDGSWAGHWDTLHPTRTMPALERRLGRRLWNAYPVPYG